MKAVFSSLDIIIALFFLAYISGCDDGPGGNHTYPDYGAANFSLLWPDERPHRNAEAIGQTTIDCTEISDIQVGVYEKTGDKYLTGDTFPCEVGKGTVYNIPVGSNRQFVVSALGSDGSVLFRGKSGAVTIVDRQIINVGRVEMKENPVSVTISDPLSGSTFKNTAVSLSGSWQDTEDELPSDALFVWTSNIDGEIGKNTQIRTSKLSEGTHTITLSVKDKYGATWTDAVVIVVGSPTSHTDTFGMAFSLIPAGTFTMGSPEDEPKRDDDEIPHKVKLTRSFYMQTTEVTQAQWEAVLSEAETKGISINGLNKTPSYFSGCDTCPVEQVSYEDILLFISVINQISPNTYRLPTEAEWEYASRAGSTMAFANGSITEYANMVKCNYDKNLDDMGWYCDNISATSPVAEKKPNAWDLYDMHGNVWELCSDWYDRYKISSTVAVMDPTGPASGSFPVYRGGSWTDYAFLCRSAYRNSRYDLTSSDSNFGFRLVCSISGSEL